MQTRLSCPKCGEVNVIDTKTLIRQKLYDDMKREYTVMFYRCKRCKCATVVQVDDMYSLQQLKQYKDLLIECMGKKMRKQTISPNKEKLQKKLSKKLRERREMLKTRTAGLSLYNEDGDIVLEKIEYPKIEIVEEV